MTLESLLSSLENRGSVTPVTPCNLVGVTEEPGPLLAVTCVTPVTPKNIGGGDESQKSALIDLDDLAEYVQERAAILEYDQGLPRHQAERETIRRACIKYRLTDLYGDPQQPGGGFAIGAEGDTLEDLLADLRRRYGDRLVSAESVS